MTVALLEISAAAYDEILGKLRGAADYAHHSSPRGEEIYMGGTTLRRGDEAPINEHAAVWVLCADRMPLPQRVVSVANAENRWWAYLAASEPVTWRCAATGGQLMFTPTHWQDLPALPEEAEKGEDSELPEAPPPAAVLSRGGASGNGLATALMEWVDAGGSVERVVQEIERIMDERIAARASPEQMR